MDVKQGSVFSAYLSDAVGSLAPPSDRLSADVSLDFNNFYELTLDRLEEQVG